jgi:hypothetical protein
MMRKMVQKKAHKPAAITTNEVLDFPTDVTIASKRRKRKKI